MPKYEGAQALVTVPAVAENNRKQACPRTRLPTATAAAAQPQGSDAANLRWIPSALPTPYTGFMSNLQSPATNRKQASPTQVSPTAPAAAAQPARKRCGEFAVDSFRFSGNSGNPPQPEPPRVAAARPTYKEAGGVWGNRFSIPPAAFRRFRRRKRHPRTFAHPLIGRPQQILEEPLHRCSMQPLMTTKSACRSHDPAAGAFVVAATRCAGSVTPSPRRPYARH